MLKKVLFILVATGTIFSTVQVFGQLQMGEAPHEGIKISIDQDGTAHALHEIQGNRYNATQVQMIGGNITNFSVTDISGNAVQYSTISQSPMTVLILPTDRNMTLIRYDLIHVVSNDNGVWKWDFYEPAGSGFADFHFPPGVDMIWANDRPVYLGDKGLRDQGNGMHLAYVINEPITVQTVQWQDKTFYVGIRTLANVDNYVFDQSAKSYAFNVDKPNSLITVIMPQELLWGPYQTTTNTNATLTNVFYNNGTHAWIGLKPAQSGTIQITGTTVVPEFPLFVPLAIAISVVTAMRFFNKLDFK